MKKDEGDKLPLQRVGNSKPSQSGKAVVSFKIVRIPTYSFCCASIASCEACDAPKQPICELVRDDRGRLT